MKTLSLGLIFIFTCMALNAQTTLSLGDIAFVAYNSDSTVPPGTGNDQFGFACLVDISSSTIINFTDQGWLNTGGFRSDPDENTITLTLSSALTCGNQVYIDADGGVKNQAGTTVGTYTGTALNFTISGDQIFAYQGSAPTDNTPTQLAKFVAAIHMNCSSCSTSNWDGDATSTTTSAKPSVFIAAGVGTNTSYFSSEIDNARYDCSTTGDNPTAIADAIYTQSNWNTDNSTGFAAFNCSFSCAVLPVELLVFKAQKRENDINLIWRTASELNNFGFEVQRSEDGRHWQSITFVAGNGTTNITQSYSFVDTKPLLGYNYYRLKQVDLDGQFEYSDVQSASIDAPQNTNLQVFPNPNDGQFTLSLFKPATLNASIRIYGMEGNLIWEKHLMSSQKLEQWKQEFDLPLGNMYYIVSTIGEEVLSEKIIAVRQK